LEVYFVLVLSVSICFELSAVCVIKGHYMSLCIFVHDHAENVVGCASMYTIYSYCI